jgi:archaellum biogenesis ATPase FlaH
LSGGLRTSSLTILTGEPGAGKSTLINQILAENIQKENNCFLYTGELDNSDAIHWLKKLIANDYHIKEFTSKKDIKYYDISDYTWDLISEWMDGRLFVPDDDFIANKNNLLAILEDMIVSKGVKLIVLDNLMTLNIGDSEKQYQEQKQICLKLKQMAKKYNIAILLVAHPKKPNDKNKGKEKPKPSMYDVLGASEIVNISDNVLRIERQDNTTELMVLKNRWGGIVNRSFDLGFDKRRSRFYTDGSELTKDYGYDKNKQFVQVELDNPF